jgi:hypothetical protein
VRRLDEVKAAKEPILRHQFGGDPARDPLAPSTIARAST